LGGRVGLCICKFATIKHSFEDISPENNSPSKRKLRPNLALFARPPPLKIWEALAFMANYVKLVEARPILSVTEM